MQATLLAVVVCTVLVVLVRGAGQPNVGGLASPGGLVVWSVGVRLTKGLGLTTAVEIEHEQKQDEIQEAVETTLQAAVPKSMLS
jgi:hypothetical protein